MTKKPENPFAFPYQQDGYWQNGMTLRDYFAGQALIALSQERSLSALSNSAVSLGEAWAAAAYELADAMLRARGKDA